MLLKNIEMPPWRNWQTRRTQNPMAVKAVPVRPRLVVLLPLKMISSRVFFYTIMYLNTKMPAAKATGRFITINLINETKYNKMERKIGFEPMSCFRKKHVLSTELLPLNIKEFLRRQPDLNR